MTDNIIRQLMNWCWNKIANINKIAYISIEKNTDSASIPTIQISYNGKTVHSVMIFPYGYQAMPPSKTQALRMSVNGNEDNLVCIPYDTDKRFKNLKPKEVKTGIPSIQSYIYFKENGDIEISTSGNVNIIAENVNINAAQTNLGVGGKKIALDGDPIVDNKVVASGTNTSI